MRLPVTCKRISSLGSGRPNGAQERCRRDLQAETETAGRFRNGTGVVLTPRDRTNALTGLFGCFCLNQQGIGWVSSN
ncbi:hypothetical protein ACVWWO_003026 [Bradyrhizobium sp. F1.13.1]